MPKKFKGENSKAVTARERKAVAQHEQAAQKQKEAEDAYWADDDKHVAKKQQRKDDKEKKRIEQLEHKKELAKMADEEMEQIKAAKPKTQAKVTRAQIQIQEEQARVAAQTAQEKEDKRVHSDEPLADNVNRVVLDGEEARTLDDAIAVLSVKEVEAEKHPEKRVKAAFLKFEEDNLPILKNDNPNMRLSQLKQMLKKDWMKSPDNPLNQRTQAYNTKR